MPLVASGLIGDHSGPVLAVSPEEARGASYLPASNVLRLPDGRLRYLPPGATRQTLTLISGPCGFHDHLNLTNDAMRGTIRVE